MTRSDLLEVVYRFYPRGLLEGPGAYFESEEIYRQKEATRRAVTAYPTWRAMLHRLGARYEVFNDSLILAWRYRDGMYGSAYAANIEIPGYTLEFYVSYLGPYYGIERTDAPGERPAVRDLAREIETSFPQHEPIPPELGNEAVPDVVSLGKTTIYQCLFSNRWGLLSGPWPPPSQIGTLDYTRVEDDKGSEHELRFGDGVYLEIGGPWDDEGPIPGLDDGSEEPAPRAAIPLTAGERS